MKITLFGIKYFDRSAKVRWLLEELGVAYSNHWLDSEKQEYQSEAYLRVNPLGRVPAIEIDGKTMFESGAICVHLADLFPAKKMAPTPSESDRPDYLQYMFLASSIDSFMGRIMIIEDIPPGELFQSKQEALLKEVREVAKHLDGVLSKQEYLVANRFTAADICVSYHFYFCMLWPEFKAITDECPHLTRYVEKMKSRKAAEKAQVFTFK